MNSLKTEKKMLTKPDLPENKVLTKYLSGLKISPKRCHVNVSWDKLHELATDDERFVHGSRTKVTNSILNCKNEHLDCVLYHLAQQMTHELPDGKRNVITYSRDPDLTVFVNEDSGAGVVVRMRYTRTPSWIEMIYTVQRLEA